MAEQRRARATRTRAAKVDRTREYTPHEAIRLVKELKRAKFDETRRDPRPHGPERPPRRRAAARHDRAAARARQGRQDRRLRPRRQGARGRGGRRGLRRRRGPRRPRPERGLHGLRRRHRDAGHDAGGRPPRPHPRPAGQDAEPEGRHGHDGRRQGGRGVQGRQGRVPHGPHGDRAHDGRQDVLPRPAAARELPGGDRGAHPRQAVRRQGQVPAHRSSWPPRRGRASRSTRRARATWSRRRSRRRSARRGERLAVARHARPPTSLPQDPGQAYGRKSRTGGAG